MTSLRFYDRVWIFLVYAITASASVYGFYSKWESIILPDIYQHSSARIDFMLDGTLNRPYVYRRLLPDIANFADRVVPTVWKSWFVALRPSRPSPVSSVPGTDFNPDPSIAAYKAYAFRFLVVYLSTCLFALLALYAMCWICTELSFPLLPSIFAPLLVLLFVPYTMNMGGYFYDYSELAMLALAAWMALRFKWWWLLPIAVLATWNKESFLFFIPTLYPLFRRRSSRWSALLGVCVLDLAGASVYLLIHSRFAHNPGSTFQVHWRQQFHFFTHLQTLFFATDKTYGITTLSAATVFPMALLAWTTWRAWPRLPAILRYHAGIAAAINVPLFLLLCAPGELRDLSLLYIALLVVVATTLNRWAGLPGGTKQRPANS